MATDRPAFIAHWREIEKPDDCKGDDELLSIGAAFGEQFGLVRIGIHLERLPLQAAPNRPTLPPSKSPPAPPVRPPGPHPGEPRPPQPPPRPFGPPPPPLWSAEETRG